MSDGKQALQGAAKRVTVMVVEDDWLAQQSLPLLMDAEDIELVGVCATEDEALALAGQRRPAVALVDMMLHSDPRAGIALIHELHTTNPDMACGVITATDPEGDLYADAFKVGARGYCRKGDRRNGDLRELARRLAAGDWVVDGEISARYVKRGAQALQWPKDDHDAQKPHLTPAQLKVLELIAGQLTTEEICGRLFITENTLKTHVRNIIAALQVRNRDQAVLYAVLKGYLNPSNGLR